MNLIWTLLMIWREKKIGCIILLFIRVSLSPPTQEPYSFLSFDWDYSLEHFDDNRMDYVFISLQAEARPSSIREEGEDPYVDFVISLPIHIGVLSWCAMVRDRPSTGYRGRIDRLYISSILPPAKSDYHNLSEAESLYLAPKFCLNWK